MPVYYDFKVKLLQTDLKIWRRFLLRSDATFEDLNDAIQESFGWMSCHLWNFTRKGRRGAVIADIGEEDPFEEGAGPVASEVSLASFFQKNQRCLYTYDFGDGWEHEVFCHKRRVEVDEVFWRRLLGGAHACPPENCGGVWGFEELLKLRKKPRTKLSEEDRERLDWYMDESWSPGFDAKRASELFDMEHPSDVMEEDKWEGVDARLEKVSELFDESLPELGYDDEAIDFIQDLWLDYVAHANPKPRKPAILAASFHYAVTLCVRELEEVSQAELASTYGTSVASISKHYDPMCHALTDLMLDYVRDSEHYMHDVAQIADTLAAHPESLMAVFKEAAFADLPTRAEVTWEGGILKIPELDVQCFAAVVRGSGQRIAALPVLNTNLVAVSLLMTMTQQGYRPGKIVLSDAKLCEQVNTVLVSFGIKAEQGETPTLTALMS